MSVPEIMGPISIRRRCGDVWCQRIINKAPKVMRQIFITVKECVYVGLDYTLKHSVTIVTKMKVVHVTEV